MTDKYQITVSISEATMEWWVEEVCDCLDEAESLLSREQRSDLVAEILKVVTEEIESNSVDKVYQYLGDHLPEFRMALKKRVPSSQTVRERVMVELNQLTYEDRIELLRDIIATDEP